MKKVKCYIKWYLFWYGSSLQANKYAIIRKYVLWHIRLTDFKTNNFQSTFSWLPFMNYGCSILFGMITDNLPVIVFLRCRWLTTVSEAIWSIYLFYSCERVYCKCSRHLNNCFIYKWNYNVFIYLLVNTFEHIATYIH